MRCFELRNLLRPDRKRLGLEVWMAEGINCIDALPPIQGQERSQEGESLVRQVPETMVYVPIAFLHTIELGFQLMIHVDHARRPWHAGLRWRSDEIEDHPCLSHVGITLHDGLPLEHLSEDQTGAPHIDCRGVVSQTQKQFRRSIPSSDDQRCVGPASFTTASASSREVTVIQPGQPEVGNLEDPFVVDQQVCTWQIVSRDTSMAVLKASSHTLDISMEDVTLEE